MYIYREREGERERERERDKVREREREWHKVDDGEEEIHGMLDIDSLARAGVDLWIMALWLKFQRFRGQVNGQFHELGIMGPGLS